MKTKIIYTMKLFLALREMGYDPIATTENPKKAGFICWIYEDTEGFEEALCSALKRGSRNGREE